MPSQVFSRPFSAHKNAKTPELPGAFAVLEIRSCYSLSELGSEVFFGDFRLR
jgi:hypothetical protein